jgi:hypothetical protein
MVVMLPSRGVTFVMMANSTGLVKSFPLEKGRDDVAVCADIPLALHPVAVRRSSVGDPARQPGACAGNGQGRVAVKPFGGDLRR